MSFENNTVKIEAAIFLGCSFAKKEKKDVFPLHVHIRYFADINLDTCTM